MNQLLAQLQCEQAVREAISEKREYTVLAFEPDGELVAFIVGPFGSYWATL